MINKINLKVILLSLKKDILFTKKQNRIKYISAKINTGNELNKNHKLLTITKRLFLLSKTKRVIFLMPIFENENKRSQFFVSGL